MEGGEGDGSVKPFTECYRHLCPCKPIALKVKLLGEPPVGSVPKPAGKVDTGCLTARGVCQMEMRPGLAVAPDPSPCPPSRLLPFFLSLLFHAFREQSPSWSSVNTPRKASMAY